MDDGGPAARSNDHTASSATSCPSRCESMRSKLTEATCSILPARRADMGNKTTTCAPGQDTDSGPHPGFRISRIPHPITKRFHGASGKEMPLPPILLLLSSALSHFFFPVGGR